MIRAFAQTFGAGVDLLEAEGRLARLHLMRVLCAGALLLFSALLSAAGIGGIAIGTVLYLEELMGLPLALMCVSVPMAAAGCVIAWTAVRRVAA